MAKKVESTDTAQYTGARAWAAEGARIGVVTCLRCGSAIVLDPADEQSPIVLHDLWHDHIEANLTEARL